MADGGWIKLYRKMRQSFVWTDANQLKLWLLLLMKASHEPKRFLFNGQEVMLNSGEMVTGRNALTFEFNQGVKPEQVVNSSFVWRTLKKFEQYEMVHISSTARYSVISIVNWGEYQQSEQVPNSSRTSTEQLTDTNKNLKNLKNDKKLSSLSVNSINDFWQQNGFGTMPPKTWEDFDYWIDDFKQIGSSNDDAVKLIIQALNVAVDNGVRKYNYANSILKSWHNKKFTTVQDVENAEKQREAQKQSAARTPRQVKASQQVGVTPSWLKNEEQVKVEQQPTVDRQSIAEKLAALNSSGKKDKNENSR